jgi:hypothetical protein
VDVTVTKTRIHLEAWNSVAEVANALFSPGFFVGDTLRDEMGAEAALRLAYSLRAAGVRADRVHALALAVRDAGDAAPYQEKEPLTEEQRRIFQGIIVEQGLPIPFRDILEAALPRLVLRRDLAALHDVLSGTYERMARIEAVRAMPVNVPVSKR